MSAGLPSTLPGQQPLVVVAATPKLTERQQAAWDALRLVPGGLTAAQVGAYVHAMQGKHDRPGNPVPVWNCCEWVEATGLSVLRSRALKPLVIHRRSRGVWEPRAAADRTVDRGAQTDRLPDWLADA
jgi:hypothetical protein